MEVGTPEDRVGYFTNVAELSTLYAAGAEVYDVKFTLRSPEIEGDARNNKIVPMSAYYDAPIYEDLLTITV
jgi:hypothetical protein